MTSGSDRIYTIFDSTLQYVCQVSIKAQSHKMNNFAFVIQLIQWQTWLLSKGKFPLNFQVTNQKNYFISTLQANTIMCKEISFDSRIQTIYTVNRHLEENSVTNVSFNILTSFASAIPNVVCFQWPPGAVSCTSWSQKWVWWMSCIRPLWDSSWDFLTCLWLGENTHFCCSV